MQQSDLPLEIQCRLPWIEQIGKKHCLYQTIIGCLQDMPSNRLQMADIHRKMASLSQAQPKTLTMVADVLENRHSQVWQSSQELEDLKV